MIEPNFPIVEILMHTALKRRTSALSWNRISSPDCVLRTDEFMKTRLEPKIPAVMRVPVQWNESNKISSIPLAPKIPFFSNCWKVSGTLFLLWPPWDWCSFLLNMWIRHGPLCFLLHWERERCPDTLDKLDSEYLTKAVCHRHQIWKICAENVAARNGPKSDLFGHLFKLRNQKMLGASSFSNKDQIRTFRATLFGPVYMDRQQSSFWIGFQCFRLPTISVLKKVQSNSILNANHHTSISRHELRSQSITVPYLQCVGFVTIVKISHITWNSRENQHTVIFICSSYIFWHVDKCPCSQGHSSTGCENAENHCGFEMKNFESLAARTATWMRSHSSPRDGIWEQQFVVFLCILMLCLKRPKIGCTFLEPLPHWFCLTIFRRCSACSQDAVRKAYEHEPNTRPTEAVVKLFSFFVVEFGNFSFVAATSSSVAPNICCVSWAHTLFWLSGHPSCVDSPMRLALAQAWCWQTAGRQARRSPQRRRRTTDLVTKWWTRWDKPSGSLFATLRRSSGEPTRSDMALEKAVHDRAGCREIGSRGGRKEFGSSGGISGCGRQQPRWGRRRER